MRPEDLILDEDADYELLDAHRADLNALMKGVSLDNTLLWAYTTGVMRGYVRGFDEGFENGRSGHALPCCEGFYPDEEIEGEHT